MLGSSKVRLLSTVWRVDREYDSTRNVMVYARLRGYDERDIKDVINQLIIDLHLASQTQVQTKDLR